MRCKTLVRALILGLPLSAVPPASAQSALPFHGSWGGGPTTCGDPFRFDARTYTPPGGDPMRIRKVERNRNGYVLSFDDDYRIVLSDVTRNRMTWSSLATDDSFELRRCR